MGVAILFFIFFSGVVFLLCFVLPFCFFLNLLFDNLKNDANAKSLPVFKKVLIAVILLIWSSVIIWDLSKYAFPFNATRPLPYKQISLLNTYRNIILNSHMTLSRDGEEVYVNIQPLGNENFSSSQLVATCVSALKYYNQHFGYNDIHVNLVISGVELPEQAYSTAYDYEFSPSGASKTVKLIWKYAAMGSCWALFYKDYPGPTWMSFNVATDADYLKREINSLWLENENRFVLPDGSPDEKSLKEFISKKLDISDSNVVLRNFAEKKVDFAFIKDVNPQAPVSVNFNPELVTNEELQEKFLNLLDTGIFKSKLSIKGGNESKEETAVLKMPMNKNELNKWKKEFAAFINALYPNRANNRYFLDIGILLGKMVRAYARGDLQEAQEINNHLLKIKKDIKASD